MYEETPIIKTVSVEPLEFPEIANGIKYTGDRVIALIDYYGQVALDDSTSMITFTSAEIITKPSRINAFNGIFDL